MVANVAFTASATGLLWRKHRVESCLYGAKLV